MTRRLALLSVLLAAASCRPTRDPKKETAVPVIELGAENVTVVSADIVRSGPLISGTLAPVRNAQIRAQVSGSVLDIKVEQGQRVSANQLLAQIDAAALRDAYLSAKSSVSSAQLAADYAVHQKQRYDTLLAAGAVSDRDRESVLQQDAQAQAALENARASLVQAEKQLGYTEVRSPFAGVVSERNVSAGDVVQMGSPLFGVVDPTRLQFQAAVPAEQIGAVHVGDSVTFTLNAYAGRTFDGSVVRINPVADPSTRQVQVFTELPNPTGSIVAGLFATGRVVTQSQRGLVVPVSAIDTRNLHPSVLRVRRGVVERVDVGLGLRDAIAERVEITAGVSAGDTLLLGQAQGLTPGTPVRVLAPTTAER